MAPLCMGRSGARTLTLTPHPSPLTLTLTPRPSPLTLTLTPPPEQKWSKGKVKEKLQNQVLFDKATYEVMARA